MILNCAFSLALCTDLRASRVTGRPRADGASRCSVMLALHFYPTVCSIKAPKVAQHVSPPPSEAKATARSALRAALEPVNVSIYPYVLAVGGTTAPHLTIKPAFTYNDPGGFVPTSGGDIIAGYDIMGVQLFSQPFDSQPFGDSGDNVTKGYDEIIPLTANALQRLHSLTLTSNGQTLTITGSGATTPVATAMFSANPQTVLGGTMTFTWNSVLFPAADCYAPSDFGMTPLRASSATAATTTIQFAAGGFETSIDCDFSDGVKTTKMSVPVVSLPSTPAGLRDKKPL